MPSSQKLPKHHSHSSITEDSHRPTRDTGRPSNPYKTGANVHKGNVPKRLPEGPMSEPHKKTY